MRFEERRRTATRNLGSKPVRIGRDPTCDWIVDYANVSRHHAVVRPLGDRNVVQDLGSTNGLRVNGAALGGKPHVLAPGDVIELTEAVVLLYEEGPFASSTPWIATAIAMVGLLIASIGLYLTTPQGPADDLTPPGPGNVASGPKTPASGTHPGMLPADTPQDLPADRQDIGSPLDFRAPRRDWQGVAPMQSSGDRNPEAGGEGEPL